MIPFHLAIKEDFLKEITYQLVLENGRSLIDGDRWDKGLLRSENKQKRTLVFGKQEEQSTQV